MDRSGEREGEIPPGALLGLERVSIAVPQLEEATAAWVRLLARRPSWQGESKADGVRSTLFALERGGLELLTPAGPGALGTALGQQLAGAGPGLFALAFSTTDADACRAALTARGLQPEPAESVLERDVGSGAFRRLRRVTLPCARTRGVRVHAHQTLSPPELLPPATAIGPEAASVHGLDHVLVRTRDPDAARTLYGEGLGLRLALDRSFEAWGVRLLFFRVGGVTVELAAALSGTGPREALQESGGDRLWGLSWQVPDIEAARERLVAAGFDVSEVRTGRRPGTRVATLRDAPAGVATLLLEPEAY